MPFGFDATVLEEQVQAVISKFRAQAAACEQSPPAPDGAGWGVPDWRDPAAYPTADELDDLEWRWEFLRRRHGYRQDWLRAPEEFSPCPKERDSTRSTTSSSPPTRVRRPVTSPRSTACSKARRRVLLKAPGHRPDPVPRRPPVQAVRGVLGPGPHHPAAAEPRRSLRALRPGEADQAPAGRDRGPARAAQQGASRAGTRTRRGGTRSAGRSTFACSTRRTPEHRTER